MTEGVGGSTGEQELAQLEPPLRRASPITAAEYAARLDRARALMSGIGADALLVGAGASLRYFAGVPWGASERLVCLVLPKHGRPVIVCPAFELGSLRASLAVDDAIVEVWEEDEDPYRVAALAAREAGSKLALDPGATFAVFSGLRRAGQGVEILDGAPVIDGCRRIKSAAELALMSEAKAITLEAHRRVARILAPGIRASEARRFIDAAHRALGADGGSTFCAVQFGEATAYPHGLPDDQALGEGDLVLIDTGCQIQGYNADITRTYVFGQPTDEQRRIWDIEHQAQAAAFAAVRPGVACEAVDRAARDILERHGLGPDYRLPGLPHRTGHGIGLSVHEAPYLVRGDRTPLQQGMCFSNEPMIVMPGRFGIRLEDHFHVTEDGAAWFTEPSPSIDAPFG